MMNITFSGLLRFSMDGITHGFIQMGRITTESLKLSMNNKTITLIMIDSIVIFFRVRHSKSKF